MAQIQGLLKHGSTLLVVVKKNGRPIQAAVSLFENLTPKETQKLREDIRAGMSGPDVKSYIDGGQELHDAFANLATPVLRVPVATKEVASTTLDNIFSLKNHARFIFECADKGSYLSVCTELGLSREQFLQIAELKSMLPQDKIKKDSKLGNAHKLIEQLEKGIISVVDEAIAMSGQVDIAEIQDIMKWICEDKPSALAQAQKFFLGDTEWVTGELKAGNYKLPYPSCLFEFERIVKEPPPSERNIPELILLYVRQSAMLEYESLIFSRQDQQGHFFFHGYGPSWIVDEHGDLDSVDVGVIDDVFLSITPRDLMLNNSLGCMARIAPYLTSLNEPVSQRECYVPSSKLNKKRARNGHISFFEYFNVTLTPRRNERQEVVYGNAVGGRDGLPFHIVRGHERELRSGDSIWIGWHYKGDVANGVVAKSFADPSRCLGPPARTIT